MPVAVPSSYIYLLGTGACGLTTDKSLPSLAAFSALILRDVKSLPGVKWNRRCHRRAQVLYVKAEVSLTEINLYKTLSDSNSPAA